MPAKSSFLSRLGQAASYVLRGQGVPAFWFARAIEIGSQEVLDRPYASSAWVQAAIAKIAGPVASVQPCFFPPDRELAGLKQPLPRSKRFHRSGRLVRRSLDEEISIPGMDAFLRSPIDGLGYSDFVEASIGWLKLAGETFWLIDDQAMVPFPAQRKGPLPQIIVARPDRMKHIVENGELVGWQYRDGQNKPYNLQPDQVIQLKYWNPYDRWRGLSKYESALIAAEGDWLAGKFKRNLMANNGDTGPYIIAKNGIPTDPQREQILNDLKAKRAAQQRGDFRPIFLTGDISVEDPKVRTVDAAYIAGRTEDHHEIFVAFDVPPSLADVKAAYSIGSASDFYQLITTGCIPIGEKFADGLERLTLKLTGQAVEILLDWDEHPVMQEVRKERLDSVDKLWTKGMPMEQISDYLGLELPEFLGWDVGYLPFSVAPVSSAESQQPAVPPSQDQDLSEMPSAGEPSSPIGEMLAALRRRPSDPSDPSDSSDPHPRQRSPKNLALWESHMRKRAPSIKALRSKSARVINDWRVSTLRKFESYASAHKSKTAADGNSSALSAFSAVNKSLIDFLFDAAHSGKEFFLQISPVLQSVVQTAGDQLNEEIGIDDPWKYPPAKSIEFIASRKGALQGVADTARDQLNTAIQNGLKEGKTMDQLADDIRGVFNNLGRYEADRIARTETTVAYGFARDAAMRDAGVEFKSWLSSHGPNVRPDHADAEVEYEASPIPLDDPFIVGGEELMYPGDPAGSPGNIINCQCVSGPVLAEEKEQS